jgi:prolyl-tRNA editing enzyme YbaK/EbsC (Cys-tRNA(Pro) deacylase)
MTAPEGATAWRVAAGTMDVVAAAARPDLLAEPARRAGVDLNAFGVAEIDPALADTVAFCAHYGVPRALSANCVVVGGRRGGEQRVAACVVLATTRADVNGLVKRTLDVRSASFLPMDEAVAGTGMEYGGITPLGLPAQWRLLIDSAVAEEPAVVVGSGLRRSKVVVPGSLLAALPGATVVAGLGR